MTHHHPTRCTAAWLRRLVAASWMTACWMAASVLVLPPATAAQCPPVAQPPTTEQIQQAARQARDRGLLWQLERDGRVAWLYGTLHLGSLETAMPGPQVLQAIQQAQGLALELDIGDPAVLQALAVAAAAPSAPLPADLQARLAQAKAAACLPEGALAGLHPLVQALSLLTMEGRWVGLDAGYATEAMLLGFFKQAQRPVVSLETPAQQVAAVVPADADEALTLLRLSLADLGTEKLRGQLARIAQVWADSDLAALERYDQWCGCLNHPAERALLQRVNDDRNPLLARRIAEVHAAQPRVFFAVGALHMVGVNGLPRLLAAQGFQVRRLVPAP